MFTPIDKHNIFASIYMYTYHDIKQSFLMKVMFQTSYILMTLLT